MLTEWALRQSIYQQLNPSPDDMLGSSDIRVDGDRLIERVIDYFYTDNEVCIFPAKTYAVALIYAEVISERFHVPFFEVLNDPNLFLGTMRDFKPYAEDSSVYDAVLSMINLKTHLANPLTEQVKATLHYARAEIYHDVMDIAEL